MSAEVTSGAAATGPAGPHASEAPGGPFDSFRLGQRPAFDGARGFLMLLVLAVHATYLLVPQFTGLYVPGGFISVDGFFVLSGFLITSLLLQEWGRNDRVSLKSFYRRRALRLFPALWTVMLAQLLYVVVEGGNNLAYELKGLAAMFLYVGNFSWRFGATIPDAFGQTWSLAVEEQFYLVWPLLLIGLIRLRNRRLTIGVMVSLIVVAFCWRALLWHLRVPPIDIYVQTETRFDSLMIGALLAYLLHTGWRLPRRINLYAGIAAVFQFVVIITTYSTDRWMFLGGYTVVAMAWGVIILALLDQRSPLGRVFALRPFRVIGRMSYSLYIWHVFVFLAVVRAVPAHSTVVRLIAGFGITAAVSVFSFYCIESPFLRRKGASPGASPPLR